MSNPVRKSIAEAGEIADLPGDNEIFNTFLYNEADEKIGYVIKWKTSAGAYFKADADSHVSLDEMM